jgi:hypothetical protein
MKSFPSGHSAAAMAGFVFLSLYFNAKMKVFAVRLSLFMRLIGFDSASFRMNDLTFTNSLCFWHRFWVAQ